MKFWHMMTYTTSNVQIFSHHKIIPADGQGHTVGPTSHLFISFAVHANQIIHFWDMVILWFWLENLRSDSWLGSKVKLIYRPYETHSCWFLMWKRRRIGKTLGYNWKSLYIAWHPKMPKHDVLNYEVNNLLTTSFGFFLFYFKLNMWHTLWI